jgi:hypothetical protein
MIDLKEVARMAKQDSEAREYVERVYRENPTGSLRWLAEDSMRLAEQMTEDLARRAVPEKETH